MPPALCIHKLLALEHFEPAISLIVSDLFQQPYKTYASVKHASTYQEELAAAKYKLESSC